MTRPMTDDFESAKARFAAALKRLIAKRGNNCKRSLLDDWIEALGSTGISSLDCSFSPRDLHDDYSEDEIVFSKTFHFYDATRLRECCSPGDDCLAGKHCIPIGGVNGADELIYVSDNLRIGIAHLHLDDVFSALDPARAKKGGLDTVVAETAARLKISLPRFVKLLTRQTDIAKFFPRHDASKSWLSRI